MSGCLLLFKRSDHYTSEALATPAERLAEAVDRIGRNASVKDQWYLHEY